MERRMYWIEKEMNSTLYRTLAISLNNLFGRYFDVTLTWKYCYVDDAGC